MKIIQKHHSPLLLFITILCFIMTGCGSSKEKQKTEEEKAESWITAPTFNADSAYLFIRKQTDFGPRVPNTRPHKLCGDFLVSQLKAFGAKVYTQETDLAAYNGVILKARNIIGAYNPEAPKRVLLCSHWDSRPYADADEKQHQHTPIDGANDGASGVGVLLEIARHLQQVKPAIGVDIVLFDAEDYGIPDFYQGDYQTDSWCLGSQYWGHIPHIPDYKARFGILLDMVGGQNATFYYEAYSKQTAQQPMQKIWDTAHRLGHGRYFIKQTGGSVTDDHVYVNRYRQIPCVDIIDLNPNSEHGFNPTWHTLNDNIDHIDKATLKAVGETVMTVIYNEK